MLETEDESTRDGRTELYTRTERKSGKRYRSRSNSPTNTHENSNISTQANAELTVSSQDQVQANQLSYTHGFSNAPTHTNPRLTAWTEARAFPKDTQNVTCVPPAKDIVSTIEILLEKDDNGTEDVIKSIKRGKLRCSQPDLLLDFIIAEKIQDQAKRSIRFIPNNNYDELFQALRQNVGMNRSRSKLESIKQMPNEPVQSYNL